MVSVAVEWSESAAAHLGAAAWFTHGGMAGSPKTGGRRVCREFRGAAAERQNSSGLDGSHLLTCAINFQRIRPNIGTSARHNAALPMKKVRSLKREVPSAEELNRAREQILKRLSSNREPDKIRTIYPSEAAERPGENVLDQITIQLRAHKRPELSEVMIYNEVTMACAQIPKPATAPAIEDEITREVAATASKLLRLLGNSALPPHHQLVVFGQPDIWNEFIERLERLAALTYRRPPRNIDLAKRACATLAYLLITRCTTQKPTGTAGGLFRNVAGLLHQYACPTQDGEIADLKTACDEVLRRVKEGRNIEKDRL